MTIEIIKKQPNLFLRALFLLASFLIVAGRSQEAAAQTPSVKVKDLMRKMQHAYQNASYLEFRVAYFYSNAKTRGNSMDSLFGKVQMDKSRCRFVIDNSETVVTEKYTIQVMKQEKTIYLSKPRHSGLMDPVSIMDSILAHMEGVHADIQNRDGAEMLSISFPPGATYTRITMTLDAKTGLLRKITYDLHTASLVGQEMIDRPGHPGPYESEGQVEVIFSGYQTGHFDDTLFDERKFFDRVADQFQPSEGFKDYHIFLASTNL